MTQTCPVCRTAVKPGEETCSSCGFKLLGKTQAFKPISFDSAGEASSGGRATEAVLRVVRGPQTGMVYRLGEERYSIGRSPRCSIFLNDMTVSREHALLQLEAGCYVISDLHSYNGVWVNNSSVEACALKSGDFIQIGTFCLLYEEKAG